MDGRALLEGGRRLGWWVAARRCARDDAGDRVLMWMGGAGGR
jgi:hypothetical protein